MNVASSHPFPGFDNWLMEDEDGIPPTGEEAALTDFDLENEIIETKNLFLLSFRLERLVI